MNKNVLYSFAYGSAAFPQAISLKTQKSKNMLDLILIVNDTYSFHNDNLITNQEHYSGLSKVLGVGFIDYMNNIKPSIYFNHSIDLLDENKEYIQCKYGIISLSSFISQLKSYDCLFLLGRLHKPIIKLNLQAFGNTPKGKYIGLLLNENKKYGFALGVLLLNKNEYLSKDSNHNYDSIVSNILLNIVGISYLGDIRFYLKGEKQSKVKDIYTGSYKNLLDEYSEYIKVYKIIYQKNNSIEDMVNKAIDDLPNGLKQRIYFKEYKNMHYDKYLFLIKNQDTSERRRVIIRYIESINLKYSIKYLLLSIFTSPLLKGVEYLLRKLVKGRRK